MPDPYRDPERKCPACNRTLRDFHERLVCDACDGMFLAMPDLAEAIRELTGVVPGFTYIDEAAGKRTCPRCVTVMSTCKLELAIDNDHVKPKPVLDRCPEHGVWFDGEELAAVFQKVIGKGPGGGVDRKAPASLSKAIGVDARARSGVPEWWGSLGSSTRSGS